MIPANPTTNGMGLTTCCFSVVVTAELLTRRWRTIPLSCYKRRHGQKGPVEITPDTTSVAEVINKYRNYSAFKSAFSSFS